MVPFVSHGIQNNISTQYQTGEPPMSQSQDNQHNKTPTTKQLSIRDAEDTMCFFAQRNKIFAVNQQDGIRQQKLLEYYINQIDIIGEENAYMQYLSRTAHSINEVKLGNYAFSTLEVWTAWKKSRRVYQFKEDVAEIISKTKLDSIPTDVIAHTPTNSMLLRIGDAKTHSYSPKDGTSVFNTIAVAIIPQDNTNRKYSLLIYTFIDDPNIRELKQTMVNKSTKLPKAATNVARYSIDCDKLKTMQDVFDDMLQSWDKMHPNISQKQRDFELYELYTQLNMVINLLTYITYSPEDIQYLPTENKPQKKSLKRRQKENNTVPLKKYTVGETIVRDFINKKIRYEKQSSDQTSHSSRRKARPHVVSAYYRRQHYGPNNSLTKLVWIPSVIRCANENDSELPLTIINVKN